MKKPTFRNYAVHGFKWIAAGIVLFLVGTMVSIAHADISNPHPTPPANSVTHGMLKDGIIDDNNVDVAAAIQLVKLGTSADDTLVPFGSGGALGTSTSLKYNKTSKKLYVMGGSIEATSTNFNGVAMTWPSADGTANQALITNGAGAYSYNAVSLSASSTTYLATSTYNKPAGAKRVHVQLWGGGGGGGTDAVQHATLVGGGGGGSYVEAWFNASDLAASVTVGIGKGGAAIASGVTSNGNDGAATTFGTLLKASGGGGGGAGATGVGGQGAAYFFQGLANSTSACTAGAGLCSGGGSNATATMSVYGAGGGGGAGAGGDSFFGGGGGGGASLSPSIQATSGSSIYGGYGGHAGTDNPLSPCTAGKQPAGGGGAQESNGGVLQAGCAGGDGEAIITTFF